MALANTAVQLARRGRRVLIVDWDLEAPGLGLYFTKGEAAPRLTVTPPSDATGLMGLLLDAAASGSGQPEEAKLKSRLHRITVPPADPASSLNPLPTPCAIDLLGSGIGSDSYGQHVGEFSWTVFFAERKGGSWLEELRNQWRATYDFVLIDSRTGLTDSGGVCTVQMPDCMVLVFTSNEQSLEDGLRLIQSVQKSRSDFSYDRPPLAVVPLLSRWDGDREVDLGAQWLGKMNDPLKQLTSSWLPRAFEPKQFVEKLRVPHVARFSFGEPLPVITHSLTDANLPGLAYESLARLLDSRLAEAGQIVDPAYQPARFTGGYREESDLKLVALVRDPVGLHREVARFAKEHGPDSPELADFLIQAADKLYAFSRLAEAEPLVRRALAIYEKSGSEHADVSTALNNLASLLRATNRLAEAEPMYRRALAIEEKIHGPEHPNVATALNNFASLLGAINRFAEAEPMYRRALAIDEKSYGPDHPEVATDRNNLAELLRATNRLAEAEPLMRRALAIDEKSYGPDHPKVAIDLNNLASLLRDTNRLAEAEPMYRRALAINEMSFGPEHPKVAIRLNNLASLLLDTNRFAEAEPLLRRALAIDEMSFGPEHPTVATSLNNLAGLLQATNRLAEAEPMYRRALAIDEKSYGPEHPDVGIDLNNLALLLQATSRPAEAEPLIRRALVIVAKFTAATGHEHPNLHLYKKNYQVLLTESGLSEAQARERVNAALREGGMEPKD